MKAVDKYDETVGRRYEPPVKLTPRAWKLLAACGTIFVAALAVNTRHDADHNTTDPTTSFYSDVNNHPQAYEEVTTITGRGANKLAQTLAPGADEHTTKLEEVFAYQVDSNGNLPDGYVIAPRADVEIQPAGALPVVTPTAPPK